jgi:hypothetical protein
MGLVPHPGDALGPPPPVRPERRVDGPAIGKLVGQREGVFEGQLSSLARRALAAAPGSRSTTRCSTPAFVSQ